MKKFLIFIIILIPIIVTVALTATGKAISMVTPDNPFGIEIRNSDNKVIEKDDVIHIDMKDEDEFIIVDVLPLMTKNGDINAPEVEEGSVGDVALERRGDTNRYSIIPKRIGSVKVVLSAAANVNVRRAVIFYITSESIETLAIFDETGVDLSTEETVQITESKQLYLAIAPIEALKGDLVGWNVDTGNSVEISANGYLTIKSRGVSRIRVSAKDKAGTLNTLFVKVDTSNAVVKKNKAYVEKGNANPEYINDVFALDPLNSTTVKRADGKFEVTYTNPDSGDLSTGVIEVLEANSDDWGFAEGPSTIYAGDTPFFLKAVNLLTGKIDDKVKFSIKSGKGEIDPRSNALFAQEAGEIVIAGSKWLDKGEVQLKLNVKERVPTLELELGIEDSKLGIQLTRKWGTYWYDEDFNMTNKYRFGLLNKEANYQVKWTSSNTDAITVESVEENNDAVLVFNKDAKGQSAVLTAEFLLYNRPISSIRKSFEFNIIDAPDYINVYAFNQLQYMSFDEDYNACLQSDIIATQLLNFNIGISFYGNGFLYDASTAPDIRLSTGAINIFRETWYWKDRALEVPIGKFIDDYSSSEKDIVFEEMRMRNALSLEGIEKRGDAICAVALFRSKFILKYMQIYNTDRGVQTIWVKDVSFEGCIMGDNGTYSIYTAFPQYSQGSFGPDKAKLTLKNNVIKNSHGPGIFVPFGGSFEPEALAEGYMPDLKIEGFLDMYNWHEQKSFARMFAKIGVSALLEFTNADEKLVNLVENILEDTFKEYLDNSRLQHLYYTHNKTKYVSIGIMALGLVFNVDANQIQFEDKRLTKLTMPIVDENGRILTAKLRTLASLLAILAPGGNISVKYDSVLTCYDFGEGREPAIKPGDPVPQSYELYARLTGNSPDLYK